VVPGFELPGAAAARELIRSAKWGEPMVGRCRSLFAGAVALAVLSPGSAVLADSPAPPRSYKQVAPGGKYVFVMIAPRTVEDDVRPWNEETAAGIREIRGVYTRSGLYRNDGSTEPLWTVDWYAHGVEVASDGIHLVRHGPWAVLPRDRKAPWGSALDQEALSFFANGQVLQTYRIGELVSLPDLLPRSVSHFTWLAEGRLDDGRMEYTLATKDGNRFVFDIRTGAIVSESRPPRPLLWGVVAILGAAVLALSGWLVVRRWRARSQAPKAERSAAPHRPRD
jgi:hypothetical protein